MSDQKKKKGIQTMINCFGVSGAYLPWLTEERVFEYLEAKGRVWNEKNQQWEEDFTHLVSIDVCADPEVTKIVLKGLGRGDLVQETEASDYLDCDWEDEE